ncbi:uncharacterized protein LOC134285415 [Aedes albopictus]|uniref:Zinc finger PHD-type domain-containing protein n=1 Tax=Aedes albopictus TaxID=7160 RepID=A0ABM1YG46_AEDAL
MNCKKCVLPVDTRSQPFIHCNGLCAAIHHAACVGLENADLAAVSPPKRNSFWLCDDCFAEFICWRNERTESAKGSSARPDHSLSQKQEYAPQRDVDELKAKVECLLLSTLTTTASCHPNTEMIRHSTPNSSRQPDREMSGINDSSVTPSASVPVVSERSTDSTVGDENFSEKDPLRTFAPCELLPRITLDGNVSEEDIQLMVARCLGACDAECRNVRKLVPRWVDCSALDYVSFKVILHCKWKATAMMSTTWPRYVKFREFRRRECTWKPDIV